jgi:yeast amino acid transporter
MATFITNYLPFGAFPVIYFGARLYFKTPLVAPEDMDFVSDIAEIVAAETEEEQPKNKLEAFWAALVSVPCHAFGCRT